MNYEALFYALIILLAAFFAGRAWEYLFSQRGCFSPDDCKDCDQLNCFYHPIQEEK